MNKKNGNFNMSAFDSQLAAVTQSGPRPSRSLFLQISHKLLKDFDLLVISGFRMKFGVERAAICLDGPRG